MPISASDIASLGSAGGNPVEAMASGYKLADLVDQRQMNKMKMQGYEQEMQDAQTLKSLARKYDTSTQEGQAKYVADAIKVNPEYGMKAQKAFSEMEQGQNELLKSQYEIMGKQLEAEAGALSPLALQARQMQSQGRTKEEINAALMPAAVQSIKSLSQTMLPNGKPVLPQEQAAQMMAKFQDPNLDLASSIQAVAVNHAKFGEMLKMQEKKFGRPVQMTGKQGPGMYQQDPTTGEFTMVGGLAPTAAERAYGMMPDTTDEERIKGIANYSLPPLGQREMNSPYGRSLIEKIKTLNPDYAAYKYKVVSDSLNKFATGKQGDTVRSIGVSMDHLSTLEEAAKALNNNDTQALNRMGNFIQQQFGLSVAPNDFATIKPLVADEVLKAVVGGAGGVTDREELQKTISAASSPAALMSAISRLKELMGGQLIGLQRQYKSATGLDDFETRILADQPEAIRLLNTHKEQMKAREQSPAPSSSGAPPSPPGATGGGTPKKITEGTIAYGPNGEKRIVRGGEWQPMN